MKVPFLKNLVFAGGILALAACSSEPEQPPVQENPDVMPGITVENARMVLPAVSGNPAAVYFDVSYRGDHPAVIRGVHVAGSENAMMHETLESDGMASMHDMMGVDVPSGETVSFAPGGKHVMVMDVDSALKPGDAVEVTITLDDGDKASFPAEVRAPGEGG